jgi:hypothetical protein
MLLGSCLHLYYDFVLIAPSEMKGADIVATVSSLLSLLPATNYSRCQGIDENPIQGLLTGVVTPAVNTNLRISPRIFGKNRNGPIGIFRGPRELIYEKT